MSESRVSEGVFGSGQWQYSLAAQFTVVSGNRTDLYSVGASDFAKWFTLPIVSAYFNHLKDHGQGVLIA